MYYFVAKSGASNCYKIINWNLLKDEPKMFNEVTPSIHVHSDQFTNMQLTKTVPAEWQKWDFSAS